MNLDTFLMSPEALLASLAANEAADFALIEGNRGLFDGFDADGGFRLSYRTLVKLLGTEAAADEAALRNAADDDAGWQVTERSMECELGQADSVQCRGANGTVRDYRKSSAGN